MVAKIYQIIPLSAWDVASSQEVSSIPTKSAIPWTIVLRESQKDAKSAEHRQLKRPKTAAKKTQDPSIVLKRLNYICDPIQNYLCM